MEKSKKMFCISCMMVFFILFWLTGMIVPANAAEKVFKWTYIETSSSAIWTDALMERLEMMSKGRIKTKVLYYGMHPYKPQDTLDIIKDRGGDFGREYSIMLGGAEPRISALELTFMFSGMDELHTLLGDPQYQDLKQDVLLDTIKKYNGMILAAHGQPDLAIMGDFWLESENDLKGKRIRTFGSELPKLVKLMGGVPVSMPYGEVAEALSRGILDGWVAGYAGSVQGKLFESGKKKVTLWEHSPVTSWYWVNMDAFNELPKDLQKTVVEWGKWVQDYMIKFQFSYVGEYTLIGTKQYGVQITGLKSSLKESLRKKMRDTVWKDWADKVEGGDKIIDRLNEFHEIYMKKKK